MSTCTNGDTSAPESLPAASLLQESPVEGEPQNRLQTDPYVLESIDVPTVVVAGMGHLAAAKALVDRHKRELGFINREMLRKAIEARSLLITPYLSSDGSTGAEVELAGMLYYYVRRDHVVTLNTIVVAQTYRRTGLGRLLFEELVRLTRLLRKTQIRLKCPVELPANRFYERLGCEVVAVEPGKHRSLNVWVYTLGNPL